MLGNYEHDVVDNCKILTRKGLIDLIYEVNETFIEKSLLDFINDGYFCIDFSNDNHNFLKILREYRLPNLKYLVLKNFFEDIGKFKKVLSELMPNQVFMLVLDSSTEDELDDEIVELIAHVCENFVTFHL